jgi:hypothetical protein
MTGLISMDSPASSSLRFRSRDGRLHDQPLEWEQFRLELDVSTDHWRETRLTIQGEQQSVYLIRSGDHDIMCADWPRSNAGHYELQVTWPDGGYDQIVTIQPGKLSQTSFKTPS